jgi:hypothetical protein
MMYVRPLLKFFVLALTASAVAAPTSPVPTIQDVLENHMKVTGFDSWSVKRQADNSWHIIAKAPVGGKVVADWIKEGNKLAANSLVMHVSKDYKLVTAEMVGAITYTQKRGPQLVTVNAPKAVFNQTSGELLVTGVMELKRTDTSTGELFDVSGNGGRMLISTDSQDPLEKATMTGPITFSLAGNRIEDGKKSPFSIKGKAGHMDYMRAKREIMLSQGVTLSGNDPSLFGDISGVHSAVITLSETREVESIEMLGDPGKTVIEQKSKSGGGKKKR